MAEVDGLPPIPEGFELPGATTSAAMPPIPEGFELGQQSTPTWGETAVDVAKQIPSSLVAGMEHIASAPAHVMGAVGKGVEWLRGENAENSPAIKEREDLKALIDANRGKGIANYLPDPKTQTGKFVRAGGEMLPAAVVQPGSLLRRGIEGAAAGVASEGAGQVAEAVMPEAEPYARAAGALIGGYPVAKTAQIAQDLKRMKAAPSSDAVKAAGAADFKAARELKVQYDPDATSTLQKTINKDLLDDGFRPGNGMSAFDRVNELTFEGGVAPSFADIEGVRRALGKVAKERNPHPPFEATENAAAAVKAIDRIDQFLANPQNALPGFEKAAEQTSKLVLRGRANWASKSRAKTIEQSMDNAEIQAGANGTGAGGEAKLRQAAARILTNPKRLRGFSAEDQKMLKEISKGSTGRNWGRYIGKGTPTGIVSAAGLGYISHALAAALGPAAYGLTAGAAYAGKKAADFGTKHAFKRLAANLRADSPLGRSMKIPKAGIPPSAKAAALRAAIASEHDEQKKGGRVDTRQAVHRVIKRIKGS